MDISDIKAHDETSLTVNEVVPLNVNDTVKIEGTSAGTLLGVVSVVVTESVKCEENVGKITAVPPFDIGECHSLIGAPNSQQATGPSFDTDKG